MDSLSTAGPGAFGAVLTGLPLEATPLYCNATITVARASILELSDPQVVVVGAGQAGLATSRELASLGVDHVVLESKKVAQAWRSRWDSFCLVTPNWTMGLPGHPYDGNDPEGFVLRDEIVRHLERFANSFQAPVREGVEVRSLESGADGRFILKTSAGEFQAPNVVLATGAYQRPYRPPVAKALPPKLLAIDAEDYVNPDALPPGRVLVVGSGQTGCQIAEDLHLAGGEVFLACGRAPWGPRRVDGRDIVTWMAETTWFETPLSSLGSPAARLIANIQLTGRGGGHDLNYRVLQKMGVNLLGHLAGVDGNSARFAPDLLESVAFGDARYRDLRQLMQAQLSAKGMAIPNLPEPPPFHADPPQELDLSDFGAVIFTAGFRPDYARWVKLPAFDDLGFPFAPDGASSVVPGLYFVGVHFLRKRKSSLMFGVGEDAAIVARSLCEDLARHRRNEPGRASKTG